jgi:hypothetical protein
VPDPDPGSCAADDEHIRPAHSDTTNHHTGHNPAVDWAADQAAAEAVRIPGARKCWPGESAIGSSGEVAVPMADAVVGLAAGRRIAGVGAGRQVRIGLDCKVERKAGIASGNELFGRIRGEVGFGNWTGVVAVGMLMKIGSETCIVAVLEP